MKKNKICIGIAFLFLMSMSLLFGQTTIMPDATLQPQSDLSWFHDGTAFASFNGSTYMFVWTYEKFSGDYRWYPYVYKYSNNNFVPFTIDNSNKLQFHYKHEEDVGYCVWTRMNVDILGNSFAFTYAGQLWFYSLIKFPPYPGYFPGCYYELWARFESPEKGWATWYDSIPDKPTKWKLGLGQVDSLLQVISWDDVAGKLVTEEYKYNGTTQKLNYVKPVSIDLPGERFGAMIAYKDTLEQNCFIYNTYTEGEAAYLTFKSPSFPLKTIGYTGVGISTLIQGSSQGMKNTETIMPEESNRFNLFYMLATKNGHNVYDMYNMEYAIPRNPATCPGMIDNPLIVLPETCLPQKVDGDFQLGLSYIMTPAEFTAEVPGADGVREQIQIFYSDGSNDFYGAFFNSDFWRPIPGSSVASMDMDDDTLYGPQIRQLWTLVGITDGAPPCSIDWPQWEEWHFADEPTELAFTVEKVATTEVTSSYEDAYSLGGKIETKFSKLFGFEASFKYANTYKSMVTSSRTVSGTLTTNFGLNEPAQELGFYVWEIPEMVRTSYMVFPWWDTLMHNPVTNSLQYQFRTTGVALKTFNHEASEFPFNINEPNDPLLTDWKKDHRSEMFNEALYNGLAPLRTITYTSPSAGQTYQFKETNRQTESVETQNSYSWGIGSTVTVPEVFKISMSYDQDISYTTENKYETEVGEEVEATLKNLTDAEQYGINVSAYDVSIYWFKPGTTDWWYYDSLDGQKPWYIGYIILSVNSRITQLAPVAGSRLSAPDMLFSWKTEGDELGDYTLFISKDPQAGPGSTIFKMSCGDLTSASLKDFKAEPGQTYYWSVRGSAKNGDVVWSESRAFTAGAEEPGGSPSLLKAAVYPNPARNGQLYVSYELPDASVVSVSIYDISGKLLQQTEQQNYPAGITTNVLELEGYIPGMYLVAIRSDKACVTKKLIIGKF
jgi:hypothetical protein